MRLYLLPACPSFTAGLLHYMLHTHSKHTSNELHKN